MFGLSQKMLYICLEIILKIGIVKYIGNIVTEKNIKFDALIKKCKTINMIDDSIPTLIIGWEYVKTLYPNVNILEKKINDKLFWTFSKNEKRIDYEKDINLFYNKSIELIIKNLNYYFCDFLTINYNKAKRLINFINSDIKKICYIENNFIYIYYDVNKTLGISIDEIEYVGIDYKKVFDKISENEFNIIINNDDFLSLRMKRIIGNNKIVVPYLFQ